MSLRTDWPGKVLETDGAAVRALLGAGTASVYPRQDDPTQIPGQGLPTPWVWWKRGPEAVQADGVRAMQVYWEVYDDPGNQYHDIDKIEGALVALYDEEGGAQTVYEDTSGLVFYQSYVGSDGDGVHDAWNLHRRICVWELRRV